jgi:glycosyltransferase involved in cell wall biosynthesis
MSNEAIERKKRELNIPIGVPIVGTVTRLREEKGVEHLIRAIPIIHTAVPEAFFMIVGDGSLRSKLAHLSQALNVERQTWFLGFRDDVADLLSLFDINVIPSLTEGFSLSFIEGMCIGTPIVATAVGVINEIGVEGENVLFIRAKRADDIADKVIQLLKNSTMREKFRQNGRRLSQKFGIESNATKLRLLYDDVITNC